MRDTRVIIVGAGMGGLSAAIALGHEGVGVTVMEKAQNPGGKMRQVHVDGAGIDAGPTVITMRDVFAELFARSGACLDDYVTMKPAHVLARHAWEGSPDTLDLFADLERSIDTIGAFSGARDAKGYRAFCQEASEIYRVLERSFIKAQKPNLPQLIWRIGPHRLPDQWRINPYQTLWKAVSKHMADPRLRQLFARYATYCGSSPFQAPATLMLVAHVERQGVWLVEGGVHRLAVAMMKRAQELGVVFRFGSPVSEVVIEGGNARGVRLADGEQLQANAVIVNADVAAAASGALGRPLSRAVTPIPPPARSMSALTWAMRAKTSGFALARHTVFFSKQPYGCEFDAIFKQGRLPQHPTVYVCAQDRDDRGQSLEADEKLLIVVNAPAHQSSHFLSELEINQCEMKMFALLQGCGLKLAWEEAHTIRTTPADFEALFPGTGGAIYGRVSHGWIASFRRQSTRAPIPGLYFAGGSVHPGPGAPMAALSGQLAARALLSDCVSAKKFRRAAMPGGISMPSATTAATD